MKQGIQTNFPHEQLREYGCYFFDLLQWACWKTGTDYSDSEIIMLYDKFVDNGIIEKDCFVVDPVTLLNILTEYSQQYRQVRKSDEPAVFGPYIVYLKKPGHGHFVLHLNGETWDSLDPDRPAAKDYKVDSYRVIS